jgi:uroporphyrinogen-III synthase
VSRVATGRSDAEGLLHEFVQHLSPEGLRVLIPRSDIGRTVIADGLRSAGAHVTSIAFYVNRRPEIDAARLRADLCEGRLHVLTFTSPSTVDHFVELLDDASRAAATRMVIAAVGRTTARALERHGFVPDVVPDSPDVRALVEAVASHVGRSGAPLR